MNENEKTTTPVGVSAKKHGKGVSVKVTANGTVRINCPELEEAIQWLQNGYNVQLTREVNGVATPAIFLGLHYLISSERLTIYATAQTPFNKVGEKVPVAITHKGESVSAATIKQWHDERLTKRNESERKARVALKEFETTTTERIATCPKCGYKFSITKHLR